MIAQRPFRPRPPTWLDGRRRCPPPPRLHADAIEHARAHGQRPGWLVALRGGTIAAWGFSRPSRRTVVDLVLLGLLLVAGLAAIGLGALKASTGAAGRQRADRLLVPGLRPQRRGSTHSSAPTRARTVQSPLGGCVRFSQDGRLVIERQRRRTAHEGPRSSTRQRARSASSRPPSLDWSWRPHPGLASSCRPTARGIAWLKDIDPASEGPHRLELWVSLIENGSATRQVLPAPAGGPGGCGVPAWSPDGRRLAYESVLHRRVDGPWLPIGRQRGRHRDRCRRRDLDAAEPRRARARLVARWQLDRLRRRARRGPPIPPARDGDPPEVQSPSDLFVIGTDGTGEPEPHRARRRPSTSRSGRPTGAARVPDIRRVSTLRHG